MKTFRNFIAGSWCEPASGEYFENVNPADTSDVIGRFPLSSVADVDKAVESATRGFEAWRRTPAPTRGDVLRKVGDLLSSRKEEIADLMTREMGKPLTETRATSRRGSTPRTTRPRRGGASSATRCRASFGRSGR